MPLELRVTGLQCAKLHLAHSVRLSGSGHGFCGASVKLPQPVHGSGVVFHYLCVCIMHGSGGMLRYLLVPATRATGHRAADRSPSVRLPPLACPAPGMGSVGLLRSFPSLL